MLSKRRFKSDSRADRASRQTGSSLEFADYRDYSPGDDLRSVDWNIYGRLERLVVKLYEQEQDLPVYILVDSSASMRWSPDGCSADAPKFTLARQIAACLAYIALANQERVELAWLDHSLGPSLGMGRGRSHLHKVLAFLSQPPPAGQRTCLLTGLRQFTQRTRRRGLVLLLSDLLDPDGPQTALAHLHSRQFELETIQILDPAELHPQFLGDTTLVDAETGSELPFTADPGSLLRYQSQVKAFLDNLSQFCLQHGIGHICTRSDSGFEDTVLSILRKGRVLQ